MTVAIVETTRLQDIPGGRFLDHQAKLQKPSAEPPLSINILWDSAQQKVLSRRAWRSGYCKGNFQKGT
jgi:hypothetical protein